MISNSLLSSPAVCLLSPARVAPRGRTAGTVCSSAPTAAGSAKAHAKRCTWVLSNVLMQGIGTARKCNVVLEIENVLLSEQKTF